MCAQLIGTRTEKVRVGMQPGVVVGFGASDATALVLPHFSLNPIHVLKFFISRPVFLEKSAISRLKGAVCIEN